MAVSPEQSLEDYGMDTHVDFDFIGDDFLEGGAVAATTKTPEYKELKSFQDFVEYEDIRRGNDGKLYGATGRENIGFIADRQSYSWLDDEVLDYINVHEGHHFIQFDDDQLWGDTLDEEYDLSEDLRQQLNQVDRLMNLAEHCLYQHTVDEARVTAVVEGYTERVTEAMHENGEEIGQNFYPGYTQLADNMMRRNGIDPEEEFS